MRNPGGDLFARTCSKPFVANGAGTNIMIDPDGNGAQAAHLLVTVENVAPAQFHTGADYIWH